ncbi:MAG: SDR family NAD(P)-dependent oxidoreductase [Nannocystis sp.]|uniref:SDR family NAD(P)-dependent oxidoreductase n=1 Tax=Nannocystis sp. TaxID=1962667 RepID=UPI0024212A54|nr:SDR family NAD(P)-dependent oxidoreductase [Nannocystis sp.]MBK9757326.1 SDR family NAD(P)-dependent oxidoreductase [Nannocystis sp.]
MPPADRPDHAEILAALRDPGDLRPRQLGPGDAAILPHAHLDLSSLADPTLLAAIPREWPLRGLWLGNSALGPDAIPALIELLARHPSLEHLELSGNSLGPRGLALLTPALAAHPGLRSLGLADNDLDGPTLDRLGQRLADHPLQHLRLAQPVPSTTQPVPSTTRPNLAQPVPSTTQPVPSTTRPNRPGDPAVWAALLRRNHSWRSLSLPACPDPTPLLAALSHTTVLRRLELGDPLPPAALAQLCSNANRDREHHPAPELARLRRSLPAITAAIPELPPATLDPADLAATLRLLATLNERPELLHLDHPTVHDLRRALLATQRRDRSDERRLARTRRAASRRAEREAAARTRIDEAQIRRRNAGVAAITTTAQLPPEHTIHRLDPPRPCYVCKRPYDRLHFFYDRLCPTCAGESYTRRGDQLDLRGRFALVTGGRVKIGHHVALRLLAWGAHVIVTSRFARDTVRRFAAHPDFASFRDRLHVFPLDLRAIPHVEAFTAHLIRSYPRLDILINNAAQTIHRPPAYYAALLADEAAPLALPAGLDQLLPALPLASTTPLPAESPLFPQASDDGFGRPLDLRERNSWRLRLDEVGTVEMLEVSLINTVAPFVLNARLRQHMSRRTGAAFIVNVSAPEGRFDRDYKAPFHPHTNMAKAALNMMTRTSADDYADDAIYMTSVDTGWASNENPAPIAAAMDARGFMPPLDLVDAATRVCDPIVRGLRDGELLRGVFLKDFRPITW